MKSEGREGCDGNILYERKINEEIKKKEGRRW